MLLRKKKKKTFWALGPFSVPIPKMGNDWRIHFFVFPDLSPTFRVVLMRFRKSNENPKIPHLTQTHRRWGSWRRTTQRHTHTYKKKMRKRTQDSMETTSSTPLSLLPTGVLPRTKQAAIPNLFFFSLFHSLLHLYIQKKKKKCWKTPWSDAPAFFSLSLSTRLCLE